MTCFMTSLYYHVTNPATMTPLLSRHEPRYYDPTTITSRTPLLWPRYYDITNPATMALLLWRHEPRYYGFATMISRTPLLWLHYYNITNPATMASLLWYHEPRYYGFTTMISRTPLLWLRYYDVTTPLLWRPLCKSYTLSYTVKKNHCGALLYQNNRARIIAVNWLSVGKENI